MSRARVPAYIGLGSNLERPYEQLLRAFGELDGLPRTRLDARSSLYVSRPLGPADQPDYINAVARLDTGLAPLELLDALQAIEAAHRRVRGRRWGPRTLDLDLLLYGEQCIDDARLRVPHPHMHTRDFVLRPLLEIAPDIRIPGRGAAAGCLRDCPDLGARLCPVPDSD
jgi:2-amino-4-hydroxy-6-hydroxymethyldihydropteridine diphosphokinase